MQDAHACSLQSTTSDSRECERRKEKTGEARREQEMTGKREEKSLRQHTDTTRSHISGHHDGALAGLEFVENPITLVLLLVSVDG